MQLSQSEQNILTEFNQRIKTTGSNRNSQKQQNSKPSITVQTNLNSNSDLNITQLQNEQTTNQCDEGDTSVGYYNPQKSQSSERQQLRFGASNREQSQVRCVFELQHDDEDDLNMSGNLNSNNRSLLEDTRKFYSNIKKSNNSSSQKYKVNNILSQKSGGYIDDQNYHTFSNNYQTTVNSGYASNLTQNLNSQLYQMPSNILQTSQNQGNLSLFNSNNSNSFNQYLDKLTPPPFVNPYFIPKKYSGSMTGIDLSNNSFDYRKDICSQSSIQNGVASCVSYSDYIGSNKTQNQLLNGSYSSYIGGVSCSNRNSQSSNPLRVNQQQKAKMHSDLINQEFQVNLLNEKRPSSKLLSLGSDHHQLSNVQTQDSCTQSRKQLLNQLPAQQLNSNKSSQMNFSNKNFQNRSYQSQDEKSSLFSQFKQDSNNYRNEEDYPQYERQQDYQSNINSNILLENQISNENSQMQEYSQNEDSSSMNILQSSKINFDGSQQKHSVKQQQIVESGILNSSNIININNTSNFTNNKRGGRFQITELVSQFNKNSRIKIAGVKNFEKHQEHDIFFNQDLPVKTEEEECFFNSATKGCAINEFTRKVISPGRVFINNGKFKEKHQQKIKTNQSNKENNCNNYRNLYSDISEQDSIKDCQKNSTEGIYQQSSKDSSVVSTYQEDKMKQLYSFQKPQKRNKSKQNKNSSLNNKQQSQQFKDDTDENQNSTLQNKSMKLTLSKNSQQFLNNSQQLNSFSPKKRIQGLVYEVSKQSIKHGCIKCMQEQKSYQSQQNQLSSTCRCKHSIQNKNKETIISNDSVFYIDLKKNNHLDNVSSDNQRTHQIQDERQNYNQYQNQQAKQDYENENYKVINTEPSMSNDNILQQIRSYNPYIDLNKSASQRQSQNTPTLLIQNNYNKSSTSTDRRDYTHFLEPKNKFQNERMKVNFNIPKQQTASQNMKKQTFTKNTQKQGHQENLFQKNSRRRTIENNKKIRSKSLIGMLTKDTINKDYVAYLIQNHASCCRNFRKELNQSFNN